MYLLDVNGGRVENELLIAVAQALYNNGDLANVLEFI